jgi:hypothetical protein
MTWLFSVLGIVAGCGVTGGSAGGAGSLDPGLQGTWYAGRGGTNMPYDPATGAFGAPTGDGMLIAFRADGSYTLAQQSITSSSDCTSGFIAIEEGDAETSGSELRLHPTHGHMQTTMCGATTDQPIDVSDSVYSYALAPFSQDPSQPGLTLSRASDGTSAELRHPSS